MQSHCSRPSVFDVGLIGGQNIKSGFVRKPGFPEQPLPVRPGKSEGKCLPPLHCVYVVYYIFDV